MCCPQGGGVDWAIGGISVPVFGFVSGLVITNSIISKQRPIDFLISISFRLILPLALVLLFTIIIIAPFFSSMCYFDFILMYWRSLADYFVGNITFNIQYFIPTVFEQSRYKGAVNGSLWCLPYFFGAYLFILSCFIFGFIRNRIYSGILALLFGLTILIVEFNTQILNIPTAGVFLIFSISVGVAVSCFKSIYPLNYRIVLACFLLYLIAMRYNKEIEYVFRLLFCFSVVIWLSYQEFFLYFKPKMNISLGVFLLSFPIQQAWAVLISNSWPWINFILTVGTVCPLAYISACTIEKFCYAQSSKIKVAMTRIEQ